MLVRGLACQRTSLLVMTSRSKQALWFVMLILVGISLAWLRVHFKKRKRQSAYQATALMYSRDLPVKASRDTVVRYIRSHGAQPESDLQPDSPDADDIMVRLGEEPPPFYCDRLVVFLRLQFDTEDKYRSASLKPELQDCL